ncbi:acetylcholinesterase-like [Homarus americanus]|uniref:acetylcholinesterase-like n=1 Tax=Homarus americanus TaxID=6706 RepID=UPI001C439B5C|nr:acetylcholinesterase-like [Homarus americanus]
MWASDLVTVIKLRTKTIGLTSTFFMLYDFLDYFNKDDATELERDKFLAIIDQIFKDWSPIEKEAIIFQYTDWENLENGYLNQKAVADVVGDYFFICPSNLFAYLYSEAGGTVYYYFFTHRTTVNPWGTWMGVLHADEIDYVFGLPLNRSLGYSDIEEDLSRRIMGYYKKFAATGRPVGRREEWPLYTRDQPMYYEWNGVTTGLGKGPRATGCAFWNELMPILRKKQGGGICESEMQKALNSASIVGPESLGWLISLFTFFYWNI